MPEVEKSYFALPMDGDKLVFAIAARDSEPQKDTVILYDGGEHALFYRDEKETIALDYLHKKAQPILAMGGTVGIVEVDPDTEQMVRKYPVSVKLTQRLPEFSLK